MSKTIKTKLRSVSVTNPDGSSRQDIIDRFVQPDDYLELEREPQNPYDNNALAAFADIGGGKKVKVGYISRELAAQISPLWDSGYLVTCSVLNKTGEEDQTIGVNCELFITTHEEIKQTSQRLAAESSMINREKQLKNNYVINTSDKSKKTALLLCIFGGYFGLHQFYVGRIGRGLIYICTVGLFAIGWFGDIISIAMGNFKDGAGVPLKK